MKFKFFFLGFYNSKFLGIFGYGFFCVFFGIFWRIIVFLVLINFLLGFGWSYEIVKCLKKLFFWFE